VPEKLENILGRIDKGALETIKNCRLLALWDSAVMEPVRKNTEPVKIKNRTLFVATKSHTWSQELSLLKKEIISNFNKQAGEEAIYDIRFKATGEV